MILHTDQIVDSDGGGVAGAAVYVYVSNQPDAALETGLTNALGSPIDNPVLSDAYGNVEFMASPGIKRLDVWYGGRRRYRQDVRLGTIGEQVSVKDKGAVGNGLADDKAAFEEANAAASSIVVPAGNYFLQGAPALTKIFEFDSGVVMSGPGAASLGLAANAGRQTIQMASAPDQFSLRYFRRNANHSGGTPGFTSAGFRADTYVGPNVTNYEWSIIGVVHNGATAGQNVGGYFQGNMLSTGHTWGGVMEACDMTYTASAGKVGLAGAEIDVYCNDVDNGVNRLGMMVVVGDAKHGRTGVAGVKGVATYGILVLAQTSGNGGEFKNGVIIQSAVDASFQTSATGTWGLRVLGAKTHGVDTSEAVLSGGSLKMATSQPIVFDAAETQAFYYDGSGLQYRASGTNRVKFLNTGALLINGSQVTGSRKTGWGLPTGTLYRAALSDASTQPQFNQALMALITDFYSHHGAIGA